MRIPHRHGFLFALLLSALASHLHAQTQVPLRIPLDSGTTALTATIHANGAETSNTLVVILPGGNGAPEIGFARPHHDRFAQRLADAGWRTVVLDYHAPGRSLLAAAQIDDISTALDTLANRYGSRIFLIGFSMGGANALRLAGTRSDIAGVVCFFSPVRIPHLPANAKQPIDHVEGIRCPVLVFQGGEDIVTDTSQYMLLLDRLRRNGIPHDSLFFPTARHGFTYVGAPSNERIRCDTAATSASIARTITFLATPSASDRRPHREPSPHRRGKGPHRHRTTRTRSIDREAIPGPGTRVSPQPPYIAIKQAGAPT